MMVYLAVAGGGTALPVINDLEYPQILNSFAYKKGIEGLTYQPKELTLDSGAFTAWNSGKSVDIDLFKTWALSVQHPNLRIVNLDVIPGEAGRTSTKDERIAGMKKSLDNADYLRAAGLNVMEVFHQDEPWDFLDLLVKRLPNKESVLCISPRNDVSTKSKIEWHKQVLKRLVDTVGIKGLPRMHGLAVTGKSLVIEFPYYSVDSSSFMTPAQYGRVLDHEGKWVKSEKLLGHQFRDDKNGGMSILIRRMIEEYTRIETLATSVWKGRGIVWE